MPRPLLRLLVVVHILMPVGAALLIIYLFTQIRNDITPLFENATTTISTATNTLNTELSQLGENFEPLANAVNTSQQALQTVLNFLRSTVFTIIDVVNTINPACSIGRTACIGKSLNVTLPTLIDLSFVDEISTSVNTITTQINNVVTGTTQAVSGYTSLLLAALLLFGAWMVSTWILFFVLLYSRMWRQT